MYDEIVSLSLCPLLIALLATLFVGWLSVDRLLSWATDRYKYKQNGELAWRDISPGGGFVGALEQVAFLFAIIVGAEVFIGAWLVFKVAAKWESWSNIVHLPEMTGDLDSDEFEARHRFGTWLLNRFLMGTLLNVLLAGAGAWFYFWVEAQLG